MALRLTTNISVRNTALYADGAQSWKKVAEHLHIPLAQVSHQHRQYAKTLKRAPKNGLSRVAGTQCLDRAWGVCKAFIPKQIKKKIKQQGRTVQNPLYKTRLFQWVWRRNLVETGVKTPQEFLAKLGMACAWQV